MVKIYVMFFSWNSFYSRTIQRVTDSKWSHVGIAFDNGTNYTVYEALNKGLIKSSYTKDFIKECVVDGRVAIKIAGDYDKNTSIAICDKYIGTPYDWASIFNIYFYKFFKREALKGSGPKAVICSEFVARALYDISDKKINMEDMYTKKFDLVTPADLWSYFYNER